MQKFDHTIGFCEKANFSPIFLAKIAENCDHNIDLTKFTPDPGPGEPGRDGGGDRVTGRSGLDRVRLRPLLAVGAVPRRSDLRSRSRHRFLANSP
jgi:hypothetical protein